MTDNTAGEIVRKILVLSMLALLPSCAKESELEPIVDAMIVEADSTAPEKPLLSLPEFEAEHLAETPDGNESRFLAGSPDPFEVLNINVVDPSRNEQLRYINEQSSYTEVLIQFYHDQNGVQPDGISPPARPDVLQGFDYVINWEEGSIKRTNKQSGVLMVMDIADSTITTYDKNGRITSRLVPAKDKLVPWGMDPRPYIPKNG